MAKPQKPQKPQDLAGKQNKIEKETEKTDPLWQSMETSHLMGDFILSPDFITLFKHGFLLEKKS